MSIVKDKTIYNCRPFDCRSDNEERTYDFLEKYNISFERIDHEQANTIESCHEIEKYLNADICKNLFLHNSDHSEFFLLLMSGDKKFVSKDISKKVNSTRLSFADQENMLEYLNLSPGSVSIMGLIHDTEKNVKVIIDSDLLKKEFFCCHPCKNTSTLKFLTNDIINKFLPATEHKYIVIEV